MTLDPHAIFSHDAVAYAYDAVDSGNDARVDSAMDDEDGADDSKDESKEGGNGPPSSDSAITISDDNSDDSPLDFSNDDSVIVIDSNNDANISFANLVTFNNNNHNMPALHIITNPAMPLGAISSLVIEDDSDSDWGFSSIEDPNLIQAIGHALNDPFAFGTGDGHD